MTLDGLRQAAGRLQTGCAPHFIKTLKTTQAERAVGRIALSHACARPDTGRTQRPTIPGAL